MKLYKFPRKLQYRKTMVQLSAANQIEQGFENGSLSSQISVLTTGVLGKTELISLSVFL